MVTDPIADLLTRIRNGQRAGHKSARVEASTLNERILKVLKEEGFIAYYERKPGRNSKFEQFDVGLKYFSTGQPLITRAERVSKPGRRVYAKVRSLPKVDSGLGISIVSTPEGVMSDRKARKLSIGGEVLALIG